LENKLNKNRSITRKRKIRRKGRLVGGREEDE
jgi:hypothetical protein